jgi:hypothetical protein
MFDMLGKEAAAQAALRPRPFHISNFTSRHIGTGPAFSGGLPRLGLFHRMAVIRPPTRVGQAFCPAMPATPQGLDTVGKCF